jgi:hypothetical protein
MCILYPMTPRGKPQRDGEKVVHTNVGLPESLWLKAKQRAAEERTDLRALIIEGLEYVLSRKAKKRGT